MKTLKPQKLTQVNFREGQNSDQIPMQLTSPAHHVDFNLSGPVVISAVNGTIVPTNAAAADGSLIAPYLTRLFGALAFTGTVKDGSKGLKVNSIPISMLWLENYILNGGQGPVVDDGGMENAGFAAATYNIDVNFTFNFFDPMTPVGQQNFTYFRPQRYDSKPFWTVEGGTLFDYSATFQVRDDFTALTGEQGTAPSLTYDLSGLVITASAYLVPAMKSSARDYCADMSYEYLPLFDLAQPDYNGINLADLEVQQTIYLINTDLTPANGSGTALVEKGSNTLGAANKGVIETDIGTDPIALVYAVNVRQADYSTYLNSVSALPAGLYIIDEYGHNWSQWATKTFLKPGIAQHLVQAQGIPGDNGSNFRVLHKTANLSATIKAWQMKKGGFPVFQGK